MSNNGQTGRPGAPQQQLSPPTDPRKRNVPPTTSSQTTQQRIRASGSRQSDRYNTTMSMTASSSSSEHPPLYGYVPRAQPAPPPPPVTVIAPRDVLLMPPPPPPPPPLASTTTALPLYTAPLSVAQTFTCGHQIPEFDPTQPPPIFRPRKRGATDNIQAGPPSKIRQTELPDGPCNDCIQRDIRSSIYQEQSVKLEQDQKVDETKFNNRLENVENGKLWLKSVVSPRLYFILEEYVENGWPISLSEPSPSSSLASLIQGTPAAPRQPLMNQLLEALISGARNLNNSMAHLQPSTSREESLLQILSGGGRRSSVPADSSLDMLRVLLEELRVSSTETQTTNFSPDMLHELLESLRVAAESEQRAPSERAGGSGNGISRLSNGGVPLSPLTVPAPAPYASRSAPAPAPAPAPPPAQPYYAQSYRPPAPPPVPAPQPAPPPQPQAQPYYAQQYQHPAATRPYYAPRYAAGAPQPPAPPPAQQFVPPYYATARPPPPDPRAAPPQTQYPQFGSPYPPYYHPGPPGPPY